MMQHPKAAHRRPLTASRYIQEATTYKPPMQHYEHSNSKPIGSCSRYHNEDMNKENVTYVRTSRLDRYDFVEAGTPNISHRQSPMKGKQSLYTPINNSQRSPYKQPLYNPILPQPIQKNGHQLTTDTILRPTTKTNKHSISDKYQPAQAQLTDRSQGLTDRSEGLTDRSQQQGLTDRSQQASTERETELQRSHRKQEKYSLYNPHRSIYKPKHVPRGCPLPQEESTDGEIFSSTDVSGGACNSANMIKYFGRNGNDGGVAASLTPKKVEVDQLVEKSENIRQHIQKISRLTPKSYKRRQQQQYQSQTCSPGPISAHQQQYQQEYEYKYLQQYLHPSLSSSHVPTPTPTSAPASTPARAHTPTRTGVEGSEDGFAQISALSKKISDRLSQIISRHGGTQIY